MYHLKPRYQEVLLKSGVHKLLLTLSLTRKVDEHLFVQTLKRFCCGCSLPFAFPLPLVQKEQKKFCSISIVAMGRAKVTGTYLLSLLRLDASLHCTSHFCLRCLPLVSVLSHVTAPSVH